MLKKKRNLFNFLLNFKNKQNNTNIQKTVLLALSFFFIVGTYSVLRPLKSSVFLGLIGKEYIPIAKLFSLINLSFFLILYSKLVDKLKQHQVLYFFFGVYIIGTILSAIALLNPTIGLQNTATDPCRIFGWIFYFFIDLFSPFIVATFWAFANSINNPEFAKKSYGLIVAFSRMGGILTASTCWFFMQKTTINYTKTIPFILLACSILILCSITCIYLITKKVPEKDLRGYTAAYKAENNKNTEKPKTGLWTGLKLILARPYVFGIFSVVYLFEIISIITDYQMHVLMSIEKNNAIGDMSSFMFRYTATFQGLGLIFALLGTVTLLKKFGVQICLLIMPISIIALMFGLIYSPTLSTVFVIMVILRALHYGFNAPIKEILYIPTSKDIKFKSKSWIESFGRSLSKTSGSALNILSQTTNSLFVLRMNSLIAMALSVVWIFVSILLGKKYKKTVNNNEVIE
ncbi:NTP/NDP exchange transporter [Candidatus Dependentiae bacterium]